MCTSAAAFPIRAVFTACFAVVFLHACDHPRSHRLPTEPREGALIAASGGLSHGFHFLPPLVRETAFPGVFDATLSPTVEICAVSLTGCDPIASYSRTGGRGSERVRVDVEEEHYIVNWHTREFDLELRRTYRVQVLVLKTLLGHVDVVLAANEREARGYEGRGVIGLVQGRTLPIRFRIEQGAVFEVAPPKAGETVVLKSADGAVALSLPAGAIVEPIALTISPAAPEGSGSEKLVGGTGYHFGPSGTRFERPIKVTINYDPGRIPGNRAEASLRMGTFVDGRWEFVPGSRVDPATNTVEAELEHFSVYGALAARRIAVSVHRDGIPEIHLVYENGDHIGRFAEYATNPAWSPDGTRLAFIQYDYLDFVDQQIRFGAHGPIAVAPVSGGPATSIPETIIPAWSRIRWSPDGLWLLHERGTELRIVRADGSGQPISLRGPELYQWMTTPDWSPDGTRIAFGAGTSSHDSHIFTMSVSGNDIRMVATGGGGEVWSPIWSGDGSKLYFVWNSTPGQPGPHEIRAVHLSSGNVTTVLGNVFGDYPPGEAPYFLMLDLLPDRSRFTFYSPGPNWTSGSNSRGNRAYWTAKIDGSDLRRAYSDEQLVAAIGGEGTTWLTNNEAWEP